jgi:hypothetical protein
VFFRDTGVGSTSRLAVAAMYNEYRDTVVYMASWSQLGNALHHGTPPGMTQGLPSLDV